MTGTLALNDPLDAVTHADPYPYYGALRASAPLHWNERRSLWVACDAASVDALLNAGEARVRPLDEPVPAWLVGTPAGDFFGNLVRMNDGPQHAQMRKYVERSLNAFDGILETSAALHVNALNEFIERFPLIVLGSALGAPSTALDRLVASVRALTKAFAPGADAEAVARGSEGATTLIELCASRASNRIEAINEAGFFIQTYDATRGLIANTLVALARDADALARVHREPASLGAVIEHTARYDSPVQNTRRFLAEDLAMGTTAMRKGDAILILIGSANWDPAAAHSYTFGSGVHACAGTRIATGTATAGVRAVLESADIGRACRPISYKPSPNARIALFGAP